MFYVYFSGFGQNIEVSLNVLDNIFVILMAIYGIVTFTFFIGNMQVLHFLILIIFHRFLFHSIYLNLFICIIRILWYHRPKNLMTLTDGVEEIY